MENLRFYDNLIELYKNEITEDMKEEYFQYSMLNDMNTIIFRDYISTQKKFFKLDNDVYVTTDRELNLSELLEKLKNNLQEKLGKSITDYNNAEQLNFAVRHELNGDEKEFKFEDKLLDAFKFSIDHGFEFNHAISYCEKLRIYKDEKRNYVYQIKDIENNKTELIEEIKEKNWQKFKEKISREIKGDDFYFDD